MAIVEKDPWRAQYFKDVDCPNDLLIPTDDGVSYKLFRKHNWVYNKLLICKTQGLEHGPHGVMPSCFPVFSKPIYNLRGMGTDSRAIRTPEEYDRYQKPGHMWMPLLTGEHVSTDVAVIDGEAAWWRHTVGKPLDRGTFDYWTILPGARPDIEAYCGQWLGRNLRGYTGMVNFETIGGVIIECHLRLADQWVDLYGAGWLESVVELYAHGRWNFTDSSPRTGYSVVLFDKHDRQYQKIADGAIAELTKWPGISSIQITFHQSKPPELHAMPPGGFRLAIANCWDLNRGLKVRRKLWRLFQKKEDTHPEADENG